MFKEKRLELLLQSKQRPIFLEVFYSQFRDIIAAYVSNSVEGKGTLLYYRWLGSLE